MKVSIDWSELLGTLCYLIALMFICYAAHEIGYNKRQKELETDFDFEKQDKK